MSMGFTLAVYNYLGCWKYTDNNDNSFLPEIKSSLPKDQTLTVQRCAKAARLRGFPVFGIRNNSVCVGSVHAALTYMRFGFSYKCYNGTGGPRTMDVYGLDGKHNASYFCVMLLRIMKWLSESR